MRYALIALILCVCGVARGQDAASNIPSVLNHGQPAPAANAAPAKEIVTAPAVVTESAPVVVVASPTRCRNGRCCTGPDCRLYNVEESVSESCRPRVFGGYVKTNTSRTVYRPARRR